MRPWLYYSAAALGFWGVWGVLGKLAARPIAATNLMLLTYAGIVAVFPLMLFMRSFTPRFDSIDSFYAIASGVFAGLGFLCFYLALSTGEVARVVVITATYPIVTVFIAVLLLGEPMSLRTLLERPSPSPEFSSFRRDRYASVAWPFPGARLWLAILSRSCGLCRRGPGSIALSHEKAGNKRSQDTR